MRAHYPIILLAFFSFIACNKESAVIDELGPDIQILAPQNQANYNIGDSIHLQIQITENLGLHGYFIWLVEKSTGYPHLIDKKHLHNTFHELELLYQLPDVPTGAYEILVEASDHDNNISKMTITINIQ